MSKQTKFMTLYSFRFRFLREDPTAGVYLATITFPTGGGKRSKIEVPASALHGANELLRRLADQDAVLPPDKDDQRGLLTEIAEAQPKQRQRYARHAGWSNDRSWFVVGGRIVGDAPEGQLPTRPIPASAGEPGKLRVKGTANEWRDAVGRPALSSSSAMLSICIALAAPLLAFAGQTSFSICLFGKTRSGKSIASLCGGSLVGIRDMGQFLSWQSTEAAIEQWLPEFSDLMVVLDDVSAMSGYDSDQYARLRTFAYMLATNQGKGRARAYREATDVRHTRYRTILLTSSESSITSSAIRARRQRQGGEAIRLIDLPVTEEKLSHIFDRAPNAETLSGKDLAARYAALVDGCRRYHGAALRSHLKYLINKRRKLPRIVKEMVADFAGRVAQPFDGQEARDLARKFGLLYAGGMLGIQAGVVPWQEKAVLAAVTTCYKRARSQLIDDGLLLKLGLQILRDGLSQLPTEQSVRKGVSVAVDGYWQQDAKSKRFVIRVDGFNRLLPNPRQRDLVQQHLLDGGRLISAQTRSANGSWLRRPKTQFIWPDGVRRRSLTFTGIIG